MDRAAQKESLQQAISTQAAQPPLGNADWPSVAAAGGVAAKAAQWLHRPVQLQGYWQSADTVFLENRQMQGRPGFYVLTPLVLQGGGAVLVQRGWVPRNFQNRTALPDIATPNGLVNVQGRIAAAPSQLYALGDAQPDPAAPRIRQNLDVVSYAQETGLDLPTLTLMQTGADGDGLQRQWPAQDAGVSKHYGYAFQWFGLSVLVAALYLWFQILRPWRRANLAPAHDF